MLGAPIEAGAHLFLWIVCILVAFIAAVSFIDFKKTHGPTDPYKPEDYEDYWKSRKHAEDVHREFPSEPAKSAKDPITKKP